KTAGRTPREPVSTPDQVRGRLSLENALAISDQRPFALQADIGDLLRVRKTVKTGDAVCNLHRPARPQRRRQVPLIGGNVGSPGGAGYHPADRFHRFLEV